MKTFNTSFYIKKNTPLLLDQSSTLLFKDSKKNKDVEFTPNAVFMCQKSQTVHRFQLYTNNFSSFQKPKKRFVFWFLNFFLPLREIFQKKQNLYFNGLHIQTLFLLRFSRDKKHLQKEKTFWKSRIPRKIQPRKWTKSFPVFVVTSFSFQELNTQTETSTYGFHGILSKQSSTFFDFVQKQGKRNSHTKKASIFSFNDSVLVHFFTKKTELLLFEKVFSKKKFIEFLLQTHQFPNLKRKEKKEVFQKKKTKNFFWESPSWRVPIEEKKQVFSLLFFEFVFSFFQKMQTPFSNFKNEFKNFFEKMFLIFSFQNEISFFHFSEKIVEKSSKKRMINRSFQKHGHKKMQMSPFFLSSFFFFFICLFEQRNTKKNFPKKSGQIQFPYKKSLNKMPGVKKTKKSFFVQKTNSLKYFQIFQHFSLIQKMQFFEKSFFFFKMFETFFFVFSSYSLFEFWNQQFQIGFSRIFSLSKETGMLFPEFLTKEFLSGLYTFPSFLMHTMFENISFLNARALHKNFEKSFFHVFHEFQNEYMQKIQNRFFSIFFRNMQFFSEQHSSKGLYVPKYRQTISQDQTTSRDDSLTDSLVFKTEYFNKELFLPFQKKFFFHTIEKNLLSFFQARFFETKLFKNCHVFSFSKFSTFSSRFEKFLDTFGKIHLIVQKNRSVRFFETETQKDFFGNFLFQNTCFFFENLAFRKTSICRTFGKNVCIFPKKSCLYSVQTKTANFSNLSFFFSFFLFLLNFSKKIYNHVFQRCHFCKHQKSFFHFQYDESLSFLFFSFQSLFHSLLTVATIPCSYEVQKHLNECKKILFQSRGKKVLSLMKSLEHKISLWSRHHKSPFSKYIFEYCDFMLMKFLWNWAQKKHPNKSKGWIQKKYFHFFGTKSSFSKQKIFFGKKIGKFYVCLPLHDSS